MAGQGKAGAWEGWGRAGQAAEQGRGQEGGGRAEQERGRVGG